MSTTDQPLNHRQQKFIEAVARGESVQQAARLAGFSPSYARKSSRLLKHPAIAQAVAAIRTEARTVAAYGLVEAMKETESAAAFARLHKNPMALVKATELRAKLSGLLVDRVEVVEVDLRGALDRAEARVLNGTSALTQTAQAALPPPAKQSTRWAARIAGDSTAEDSEGPTDGKMNT